MYLTSSISVDITTVRVKKMSKAIGNILQKNITLPMDILYVGADAIFGKELPILIRSAGGESTLKKTSILGSLLSLMDIF